MSLIGTPRGLTNGGERPAVKRAKLGAGRLELRIPFLLPILVGLLGAVLIFVMASGQAFESARVMLAVAGVAVVAIAGLLILRFR